MQNEVLKAIADRRSIRSYTGDQLTDAQLELLKNAALQAPSAVNRQPYHFTFVRDAKLLEAFSQRARELLAKRDPSTPEDFSVLRGAPCVCFIFADPENGWSSIDSGIAVENIALAAHSIGLGSVILGMPRMVFEADAETWNALLSCPEGMRFCIAIGLGVPAAGKDPHPVRDGLVTVIG